MKVFSKKIDNVMKRIDGEKLVEKLNKITENHYANIEYSICPAYGSFDIYIKSCYEFESDNDLLELFNWLLIQSI